MWWAAVGGGEGVGRRARRITKGGPAGNGGGGGGSSVAVSQPQAQHGLAVRGVRVAASQAAASAPAAAAWPGGLERGLRGGVVRRQADGPEGGWAGQNGVLTPAAGTPARGESLAEQDELGWLGLAFGGEEGCACGWTGSWQEAAKMS